MIQPIGTVQHDVVMSRPIIATDCGYNEDIDLRNVRIGSSFVWREDDCRVEADWMNKVKIENVPLPHGRCLEVALDLVFALSAACSRSCAATTDWAAARPN